MNEKFDAKIYARSLSRILNAATMSMSKAGGSLHSQRLIDYVSNEFQKITEEQALSVLKAMDARFQRKLLKDANGTLIGYAYSRKIFVMMRREQGQQGQFDFLSLISGKAKAPARKAARKPAARRAVPARRNVS